MLIFTLFTFQGKAQEGDAAGGGGKKNISFGAKAGLNLSSLTSDYVNLPDVKVGYQFGAFAKLSVLPAVSVEMDVLYARFGSSSLTPEKVYTPGSVGTANIVKSQVALNTLEVPVLANIYILELGGSKIRAIVGPEMNFYLSSIAMDTRKDAIGEMKSSTVVSGSFQSCDFAVVAGIGMDFQIGNHKLGTELRYRSGITPVNIIRSSSFKDFGLNALSLNVVYNF